MINKLIKSHEYKHGESGRGMLLLCAAALICAFLVCRFLIIPVRVVGPSMKPSLNENSWVLASRVSYLNREPQVDDIIVFKRPELTEGYIVKRVAALPKDVVEIKEGIMYRNGVAEKNGFEDENFTAVTVPDGFYFVLGDNLKQSLDSRVWAQPFVDKKCILGKVILLNNK